MSKLRAILFLLFNSFLFQLANGQQPKWANDYPELLNDAQLVQPVSNLMEKYEMQKDYWTLIGVIDDLSKYRSQFLIEPKMINLFPTAYFHTTVTEMKYIAAGRYRHPIEKMKQMIAFYEAYKFNRTNWEVNKTLVENHWKQHFEFVSGSEGCLMVGFALATAISAHIKIDLPRALKYTYTNRFDKRLSPADLQPDFDASDSIFVVTVKKTLQDISASSLCPAGAMEKAMTFDSEHNHVAITLVNSVYEKYHAQYPALFSFLGVQQLYTDQTVIDFRHKAWVQAFQSPTVVIPSPAVQPTIHNQAYLAAWGREFCGIPVVGSVSSKATLVGADTFEPFSEGYAVIQKGNRQGMIDARGHLFIPYGKFLFGQYEGGDVPGYHNSLCKVYQTASAPYYKIYGFIDLQQQLCVSYKYVYANFITSELGFGRLPLPNDKPLHLIDRNGRDLGVDLMNSGLRTDGIRVTLVVREQGHGEDRKYGFTDVTGKLMIPVTYVRAHDFCEGLAAVKKGTYYNSKWGYITENGAVAIPFIYDQEPGDFHNGRAMVLTGAAKNKAGETIYSYGYVDKYGRFVVALTQKSKNLLRENRQPELWTSFSGGYLAKGDPTGGRNEARLLDTSGIETDITTIYTYYKYRGRQVNTIRTYSDSNTDDFYTLKKDFDQLPLPVQNGMMIIQCYQPKSNPGEGKEGMITVTGECVIPPIFNKLSPFDPVSGLAYAELEVESGTLKKGYIDISGLFTILKQ